MKSGREVTGIKDIKTKNEKKPKVRSGSARMPKELARTAALQAKEKAGRLTRVADGMEDSMVPSTEESPQEYAATKVSSIGRWTGSHAIGAAYAGGKKLAVKNYGRKDGRILHQEKISRQKHPVGEQRGKTPEREQTHQKRGSEVRLAKPVRRTQREKSEQERCRGQG